MQLYGFWGGALDTCLVAAI